MWMAVFHHDHESEVDRNKQVMVTSNTRVFSYSLLVKEKGVRRSRVILRSENVPQKTDRLRKTH